MQVICHGQAHAGQIQLSRGRNATFWLSMLCLPHARLLEKCAACREPWRMTVLGQIDRRKAVSIL